MFGWLPPLVAGETYRKVCGYIQWPEGLENHSNSGVALSLHYCFCWKCRRNWKLGQQVCSSSWYEYVFKPSIWDCQQPRKLRPRSEKTESGVNNQTPRNTEEACAVHEQVSKVRRGPSPTQKELPFLVSSGRSFVNTEAFCPLAAEL